jgi:hypothetical protein
MIEEPKTEEQQHRTSLTGLTGGYGLTGEEHRSDLCAMTQSGDFDADEKRRDRKACVEAKQVSSH